MFAEEHDASGCRRRFTVVHVVSLSEDRRQRLESRMRTRLLGARQDGLFTVKAKTWCVRGEVPKS
jgi:hypothetical protein